MKLKSHRTKSVEEIPEIILSASPDIPDKQKNHWKKLRSILHVSSKLKVHEAQEVEDVNNLINTLERIPTNKSYRIKKRAEQNSSPFAMAVADHRRDQLFFQVIEKGDPEEIKILEELIDTDPKKYMRNAKDPNSIINCKNRDGYTPIYLSCRNGILEYVDFFLKQGADQSIKCGEAKESCLEAAARWGYAPIVKLLMKNKCSIEDIRKAKKVTKSRNIMNILNESRVKGRCCW
ncbi:hypothetical protein SteCoe_22725 [Stentor coeruleus]|uniref:Uncharacterized protein n=1 Tax=Stentor coeruleus TaxID=5963 RepID=A0A1R2BLP0_9CILI|nr:hypothetical protein SteCoe_22725 [Stentor coeruleus]